MSTFRRLLTLGVVAYSTAAVYAQDMNPIEMGADVPMAGDPGASVGTDMAATAAPADGTQQAASLPVSPPEVVMLDNGEQAMKRECVVRLLFCG